MEEELVLNISPIRTKNLFEFRTKMLGFLNTSETKESRLSQNIFLGLAGEISSAPEFVGRGDEFGRTKDAASTNQVEELSS